MSTDLYWRPAPDEPPPSLLPSDLKYKVARRVWAQDGSTRADPTLISWKDEWLRAYLEGLADAGVEGAGELVDILRAHRSIIMWIE